MTAMKYAVGGCSVEGQSRVLNKAFSILSSSSTLLVEESLSSSSLVKREGSQLTKTNDMFACRDEWIISLFASVIISLHPETRIENAEVILQLFTRSLLSGHIPSAHALGSLLNKLPLKGNELGLSAYCTLEEAMNVIFNNKVWRSSNVGHLMRSFDIDDGNGIGVSNLGLSSLDLNYVHGIVGLAWMGKGLLIRGHEKVKDLIMVFLSCLMVNNTTSGLLRDQGSHKEQVLHMPRYAADSFHIIMSDSEACLNKRYHATIRPLYKQRFFHVVIPILRSSVVKSDSPITRSMLYRALAHVISNTPVSAILGEAPKLIPLLLDGLSMLSEDILNRDMVYNVLLVLSGILTDKNAQETVVENAHIIIRRLDELVSYPHMMIIRETAIQCLTAMSELPRARLYPMRTQCLGAPNYIKSS